MTWWLLVEWANRQIIKFCRVFKWLFGNIREILEQESLRCRLAFSIWWWLEGVFCLFIWHLKFQSFINYYFLNFNTKIIFGKINNKKFHQNTPSICENPALIHLASKDYHKSSPKKLILLSTSFKCFGFKS